MQSVWAGINTVEMLIQILTEAAEAFRCFECVLKQQREATALQLLKEILRQQKSRKRQQHSDNG